MTSPVPLPLARAARIRRVSRFFRRLTVLAGLMGAITIGFAWVAPVVAVGRVYAYPGSPPVVGQQPEVFLGRKLFVELAGQVPEYRYFTWDISAGGSGIREGREYLARGAAMLWSVYGLWGAVLFYRLFRGYEQGEIFARASVRRLKLLGVWMMGLWFVGMAFQLSKVWWAVSTQVHFTFDLGVGLLPGLFIFLIGWIMEEAQLLDEEQALTV